MGFDRPWRDLAVLATFASGMALGLPYLIPFLVCLLLVGAGDLSSVEEVMVVSLVVAANSWRVGYWLADGLKTAWRNRYHALLSDKSQFAAAVETREPSGLSQ